MSERAIVTEGLTKNFGSFGAVCDMNLEVKMGEVFGLLGPDGAGKTTTIRMLSTLVKPSRGKALVVGHDMIRESDKVRQMVGVVSDGVALYKELTVEENLKYLSTLYALPKGMAEKRITELLEMFGLKEKAKRLFNTLSTGMAKKVMICAALLHNPRVLLLDEVTSGLDPQTAIALRDFARSLRDQSVTVIWTTHYMDEPEKLCDRVGIIMEGKLIQIGTPGELKHRVNELSVLEIEAAGLSSEQVDNIRGLSGSVIINYVDPTLQITSSGRESLIEDVAKTLLATGAKIKSINTREPTLEDAFLSLTTSQGR